MAAATRTRIGPADHGRTMTLQEFLDAEETPGYRYELARRVIEVSDVPNDSHAKVVDNLHEGFSDARRRSPGVIDRITEASGVQVVIPVLDFDRHPDLAVIFVGKAPDDRGRRMPDLVVEVVSPGREARHRDYVSKRADYLAFGILEYWIVDPRDQLVTVLSRPDIESEWTERIFRDDEPILSPLLPGLALRVDELWIGADL